MNELQIVFPFDMRKGEYLATVEENYSHVMNSNPNAIKNDKVKFAAYYDVDLEKFVGEDGRFSIPYEMSDLYCLMMAVMKSSPTYDMRANSAGRSFQDIINHSQEVIGFLDYLPPYISDYIKLTPEYHNTMTLIHYMPIVLERVSAIINLALDARDIPLNKTMEYLIDGLDDTYERFFWDRERRNYIENLLEQNKDLLGPSIGKGFAELTVGCYHMLDHVFAELFNLLERGNWPADAVVDAKKMLRALNRKYKDDKNREAKTKQEYFFWLCNQSWHVLHETIDNPIVLTADDLLKKRTEEFSNRYNKDISIPDLIPKCAGAHFDTDILVEELARIRTSLQNSIDTYIVDTLRHYCSDMIRFTEVFHKPPMKFLSYSISSLIACILSDTSNEDMLGMLSRYLNNIYTVLADFDDKYKRFGLAEYVLSVTDGSKDMDRCCQDIYRDVFTKIQTQKCDHYNRHNGNNLSRSIGNEVGKSFVKIIERDVK